RALAVCRGDPQREKPLARDRRWNIRGDRARLRQPADPRLGDDLPRRCRAHVDLVVRIADECPHLGRHATVTVEPPEERVRVEKKPHSLSDPVQAMSSSGDSGAKNAGVVPALPLIAPNLRRGFGARTGTSRTTGVLPRAMITSSPARARSINRERFVLAA